MFDSQWDSIIEGISCTVMSRMDFLRDDADHSYHFFNNNMVTITREEVQIVPYHSIKPNTYIWANKIKAHNLSPVQFSEETFNKCYFYKFLKRIAGIPAEFDDKTQLDIGRWDMDKLERLHSFMTAFGYLCTNFKDPGQPFCVLIAEDTPDDGLGGGTGKGLLIKLVAQFCEVCIIDGKTWSPENSFAYQRVSPSTDLISIEDAKAYFQFELLYNVLTEGVEIEKKRQDSLFLPYAVSPKIVITTNYDILDSSVHGTRRVKKVLLARYFNRERTPRSEFDNKNFFYDWTEEDWNLFYTFGFQCIQLYMSQGIIEQAETENSLEKAVKLRAGKHGEDFYEFVSEKFLSELDQQFSIVKKDFWRDFLNEYELTQKDVTLKQFSNWVLYYCTKYNVGVEEKVDRDNRALGEDKVRKMFFDLSKSRFKKGTGEGLNTNDLPF